MLLILNAAPDVPAAIKSVGLIGDKMYVPFRPVQSRTSVPLVDPDRPAITTCRSATVPSRQMPHCRQQPAVAVGHVPNGDAEAVATICVPSLVQIRGLMVGLGCWRALRCGDFVDPVRLSAVDHRRERQRAVLKAGQRFVPLMRGHHGRRVMLDLQKDPAWRG